MRKRGLMFLISATWLLLPSFLLAGSATIQWQANHETDLKEYRVYHGTASRSYGAPVPVGKVTSYTFNNLAEGFTHYFAVTAVDTSGNESGFSAEVSKFISAGSAAGVDAETEILWRNTATGENLLWYMNGATFVSSAALLQIPNLNWNIAGTVDFNNDGNREILWRNTATGENLVWYMDGVNFVNYVYLRQVSDLNWNIVGTGDFNGDGKADILWRNKKTGDNTVWYMDGVNFVNYVYIRGVADLNWNIVGTGDFNGDGKTDIVWRNAATGNNTVWYMDGVNFVEFVQLRQVADLNWNIVGNQ